MPSPATPPKALKSPLAKYLINTFYQRIRDTSHFTKRQGHQLFKRASSLPTRWRKTPRGSKFQREMRFLRSQGLRSIAGRSKTKREESCTDYRYNEYSNTPSFTVLNRLCRSLKGLGRSLQFGILGSSFGLSLGYRCRFRCGRCFWFIEIFPRGRRFE